MTTEQNTKKITGEQACNVIWHIWFAGQDLTSRQFAEMDAVLPNKELPILDRLLSVAGLLERYNADGRPAFANFREWWRAVRSRR